MKLDFCIFFITSKCNSNCRFCFYKDKLNRGDDLSLEEIRKISLKMGDFTTLLLSGGEPFLREDLPEAINIFVNQNKVKIISIPTNGIDTQTIFLTTEEILNSLKDKNIKFLINASIDALESLDANLRGSNDAFSSVTKTIKELARLKIRYKNFYISVNSVFSNASAPDFEALIRLIGEFNFVDFHDTEILRPKHFGDYAKLKIDISLLKKIHLLSAKINRCKLKRRVSQSNNLIQWMSRLRRLVGQIGSLRYTQTIKEKFLEGRCDLFNCLAGRSVCVIESDGDVKLCELREDIGNLRNYNYELKAILDSPRAKELRDKIIQSRCNCTHTCFISEYIRQRVKHKDLRAIFLIVYHYFKFMRALKNNLTTNKHELPVCRQAGIRIFTNEIRIKRHS